MHQIHHYRVGFLGEDQKTGKCVAMATAEVPLLAFGAAGAHGIYANESARQRFRFAGLYPQISSSSFAFMNHDDYVKGAGRWEVAAAATMMDDPFGTVHFLPFQSVDGNCFIGQPSAGNVSQPFLGQQFVQNTRQRTF